MTILSDTGPIIALAKVKKLYLLKSLFENVYIAPYVHKELMAKTGDEADEIDKALKEYITLRGFETSPDVNLILRGLGSGEKE